MNIPLSKILMMSAFASMLALASGCGQSTAAGGGKVKATGDEDAVAVPIAPMTQVTANPRTKVKVPTQVTAKPRTKVKVPTQVSVCVCQFDDKSRSSVAELSTTIRSRILQRIDPHWFTLVEREQLETVLTARTSKTAGVADGASADREMIPAAYVIYGSVLSCDCDRRAATDAFTGWSVSMTKYKVRLHVKLVDAETDRVVSQKTVVGNAVVKNQGAAQYVSSSGNGMDGAIDEACHMAADILRDIRPVEVTKVDKGRLTLAMSEMEAREGDVFDLIEVEEPIFNKATGDFMGYEGETIGRIKITDAGSLTSKAIPMGDLKLDGIDLKKSTYIVRRTDKAKLLEEAKRARTNTAFEGHF